MSPHENSLIEQISKLENQKKSVLLVVFENDFREKVPERRLIKYKLN